MIKESDLKIRKRTTAGDVYRCATLVKVEDGVETKLPLKNDVFSTLGYELDEMHMLNILFREAAFVLKGTEYEKVVWKEYPDMLQALVDYSFIKRISSDRYVYLYVDYYFHT